MGDAQRRATHINGLVRAEDFTNGNDFITANLATIEVRLERLAEIWGHFCDEHMAIVENTIAADNDAVQLNNNILTTAENRYLAVKAALVHKRYTLQAAAPAAAANAAQPANQNNGNVNPIAPAPFQGVQIQFNQQLPRFDGEYAQWPQFRDLYMPLVHNDDRIVPAAKFTILRNHLTGQALDVIAGMAVSAANYQAAWDLIFQMYDNSRLITQSLLKIVRQLRSLTSDDPVGLRFIVIKYRQVTRELISNGENIAELGKTLLYDLTQLLDSATRTAFEAKQLKRRRNNQDAFTLEEALDWLETRAQSAIRSPPAPSQRQIRSMITRPAAPRVNVHHAAASDGDTCPMCKGQHVLEDCESFNRLAPYVRSKRVLSFKVCLSCFSRSHSLSECPKEACQHCDSERKHHRLLCFTYCDKLRQSDSWVGHIGASQPERSNASTDEQHTRDIGPKEDDLENPFGVLLATALVNVRTVTNTNLVARALCDNGAQANVISEEFVQKLRLQRRSTMFAVTPVGNTSGIRTRGIVRLTISTRGEASDQVMEIYALVMSQVSSMLPNEAVQIGDWPAAVMAGLADPTLCDPGPIDILLGAHVWAKNIRDKVIRSENNDLIAHDSNFGWLIYGGLMPVGRLFVGELTVEQDSIHSLNATMQRFFELESVVEAQHRSQEQILCEEIFKREVRRNKDGRYVVPIPIDPDAIPLGASKRMAYRRYLKLEDKFCRDLLFYAKYVQFMADYIQQGHMTMLTEPIEPNAPHYYIPHHAITAKNFRTVFDGSALTSSGQSLNDIQLLGERLQDNLSDCIIRFRLHRIGIRADIKQMYRQILVDERYRNYMLIFWRPPGDKQIREYRLNTVTYGLKHAPHSAVRVLHKCAEDGHARYPLAAQLLKNNFYMDDLTAGADTHAEVMEMYSQITFLLRDAGFELRKWASNDNDIIEAIGDAASSQESIEFKDDDVHSVLGVIWHTESDTLRFIVQELTSHTNITKRTITSAVAKLFDPTGMLAPFVTRGKILIRELWLGKFAWDDSVTGNLLDKWNKFYATIRDLENVRVPRWMGAVVTGDKIDLHCFADASESAYCAVIYSRIRGYETPALCTLLIAKTKVAPIKPVTIPRLELSAALLVSRLATTVQKTLEGRIGSVTYWLDSKVALQWIAKEPFALKTFVANRVKEIQESTNGNVWRYVPSAENPADMGSRGTDAPELLKGRLWWHGPEWLQLEGQHWPRVQPDLATYEKASFEAEHRPPMVAAVTINEFWIANRYSDFAKLCLVTAFIMRFCNKIRFAASKRSTNMKPHRKRVNMGPIPPLTRDEWLQAQKFWFRKMCRIRVSHLQQISTS